MDRRRSTRLHPRIQPSEKGNELTCRYSPRLHPQIQRSEEGAGVIRRRNPRLHLQIHASDDGAGVVRRRRRSRGTSPVAPASLPDNDDMLREILLRLPPQPSSLPRASAVCKRWWGLITDPKFRHSFRAHHRKPPLLGVFQNSNQGIIFKPILNPPDRIPPQRFDLGGCSSTQSCYYLVDCRHGLILVRDCRREELVVYDPITGVQRRVAFPLEFRPGKGYLGAVFCAAGDHGHVHGGCRSSPFKVVLVSPQSQLLDNRPTIQVYTSEIGVWGNPISAEPPCNIFYQRSVLISNCLYWVMTDGILEFDLDENNLTVIKGPPVTNTISYGNFQIIQTEDGVVGFVIMCFPHFHMWQRNVNDHGFATWVPWKTIEMHTILKLPPPVEGRVRFGAIIRGYDEDTNVIFVTVDDGVYMVQLNSMQSRKLDKGIGISCYHPFNSFDPPGTTIHGCDEANMLHNP